MALVIPAADIQPNVLSDLAQRKTVTGESLITRYEAKAGAVFEAHSHPEEQMGYVIKVRVEFFVGEREERFVFEAGTFFRFASNERHRSRVVDDCMVIDVFSPPRPQYLAEAATSGTRE